jgi:hypothetical protein
MNCYGAMDKGQLEYHNEERKEGSGKFEYLESR